MLQRSPEASPASSNRRAFWLRQLRQWHWISAAVSLLGTLLFAITGITLNHAGSIEAKPAVTMQEKVLPLALREEIERNEPQDQTSLPVPLAAWIVQEFGVDASHARPEWSDDEIYVALPRPGGDAWIAIDRQSGDVRHEVTDRGWISYLNDLHKGRNTGLAWSLFIDAFAVACIFFCLTGLVLLQLYSGSRPLTWPLVGFGCALPILIAFLLIH
jgi:hypothetical protein